MTMMEKTKAMGRKVRDRGELTYRRVTDVGKWFMKRMYRYTAIGGENMPDSGPTLVVVNHLHLLDPFVVSSAIRRKMVTMVAAKWSDNGLVAKIMHWAGVVYVRRGEVDRKALRAALKIMNNGEALAMAPEGTRSKTGTMARGKPGAAYMALKADAVIVPVGSWGVEQLGKTGLFKRPECHAVVGEPFRLPPIEGRMNSARLQELSDLVMMQIGRLLPPAYRGEYADDIAALEAGTWQGLQVIPVRKNGPSSSSSAGSVG